MHYGVIIAVMTVLPRHGKWSELKSENSDRDGFVRPSNKKSRAYHLPLCSTQMMKKVMYRQTVEKWLIGYTAFEVKEKYDVEMKTRKEQQHINLNDNSDRNIVIRRFNDEMRNVISKKFMTFFISRRVLLVED